jgi:hypothetical protein
MIEIARMTHVITSTGTNKIQATSPAAAAFHAEVVIRYSIRSIGPRASRNARLTMNARKAIHSTVPINPPISGIIGLNPNSGRN